MNFLKTFVPVLFQNGAVGGRPAFRRRWDRQGRVYLDYTYIYIYIGLYNTNYIIYIYNYTLCNPIIQVLTRHIYDTNPIIEPDGHTNIFRGSYRFLHPLEGIPNDCTLVYHVLTMAHLMMLVC